MLSCLFFGPLVVSLRLGRFRDLHLRQVQYAHRRSLAGPHQGALGPLSQFRLYLPKCNLSLVLALARSRLLFRSRSLALSPSRSRSLRYYSVQVVAVAHPETMHVIYIYNIFILSL